MGPAVKNMSSKAGLPRPNPCATICGVILGKPFNLSVPVSSPIKLVKQEYLLYEENQETLQYKSTP